ncbi:twin transmembrane helix small protein [Plastoroseomonas arctica]|uniref:Twin transmembrane helix small protein n=1 Tax=Plastoroseomonas arctica TaxID=1509237 RepID=A0AAF1KJL7_9PROT|nr:twin transmembrane helix small protein [Plastoroseomonas arctica]MBR0655425.1 twin transmembrane helix small protein [Plastoroseomonas arctica]
MKIALTIIILAAMLATVGVLLAGLLGMARGDQSPHRSNKLMQWRIGLQGLALVLIALLMWIWRS